jgi:hypothetical protein
MTDDIRRDTATDEDAAWNFQVRHLCVKCDRLAVVYDDDDQPLCGRHATIFMTATRTLSSPPFPEDSGASAVDPPASDGGAPD